MTQKFLLFKDIVKKEKKFSLFNDENEKGESCMDLCLLFQNLDFLFFLIQCESELLFQKKNQTNYNVEEKIDYKISSEFHLSKIFPFLEYLFIPKTILQICAIQMKQIFKCKFSVNIIHLIFQFCIEESKEWQIQTKI